MDDLRSVERNSGMRFAEMNYDRVHELTHLKLIILEGRRTRAHNEVVRYIWHKA